VPLMKPALSVVVPGRALRTAAHVIAEQAVRVCFVTGAIAAVPLVVVAVVPLLHPVRVAGMGFHVKQCIPILARATPVHRAIAA
jgi:hypothetical protein